MKSRLLPLVAAIYAITACGAARAAAASHQQPEIFTGTRTIVIENGAVIEQSGGPAPDVFLAQASPDNVKKQVKVITSGPGVNLHNMSDIDALVSSAMSEAFAGAAHGPFAKTVKNAPYSAEVITEKNQALPDGNQISKRTTAMTFRDSTGRTRQETRDAKGDVKIIHINDSVDGTRFVLSPSSKSATKLSLDKEFSKHIAEMKEKAKAMSKDGNATFIEQSGPGHEIIVKRIELPGTDGKKEGHEEVKVKVIRVSGDPNVSVDSSGILRLSGERAETKHMAFADTFSQPGMLGNLFQDGKWSSKSTTTPLGTKEIEGVRVDGKSVSYTIPAGEVGNKNPIIVTTETWYSPDLQATVYSKSSDPRVGETIYRLANVKRTEQPAALFTVPDGYSVKEMPGMAFSTKRK